MRVLKAFLTTKLLRHAIFILVLSVSFSSLSIRRAHAGLVIASINISKTLIIALSSKCDHCTETVPFWKRVIETNIENKNATRIVAVFPETAVEVGRYLHEQQLGLNTIPGINYKAINLPGTPSAVLLDNEGKIVNFWIGKPSKDAEQEILDAVTRSS